MESASQAPVTFSDIMCQMHDMLSPAVPGQYTLRDLRKSRALAGTLFNILFNLGKFVAYETRDPFMQRQEKADDPDASDWDRCAPPGPGAVAAITRTLPTRTSWPRSRGRHAPCRAAAQPSLATVAG